MPDPIPRNRSARGRQPRRSVRQRIWPVRPAQRPRGNVEQPAPPPRQQPPPARLRDWPNPLLRRPQENAGRHAQPTQRPRPPARQRDWPNPLFRRSRENTGRHAQPPRPRPPARQRDRRNPLFRRPRAHARRPGPRLPRNAVQSGAQVAVGTLLLAVASLVVWIVVPLFPSVPSGISSGTIAASPLRDHADVGPVPGNDPVPVDDQPVAPPDAVTGADRGPVPESATPVDLTTVRRDSELPATESKPNPAPPSQLSEPANADLGRRLDQPEQNQERPPRPRTEEQKPPPETQKPPPPPPDPGPTPEEREQREKLVQQFKQAAQKLEEQRRPQNPKPQQGDHDRESRIVANQGGRSQSGTSSQQKPNRPQGGESTSSSSSGSNSSVSSGSE